MRIAFVSDNVSRYYGNEWTDGLYAALEILKTKHEVGNFEPTDFLGLESFRPDVLLFWGALSDMADHVRDLPYKKACAFAGGPITRQNIKGFDLFFYESLINKHEFEALGVPCALAFGVNETIFYPEQKEKKYDASFAGSFSLWKRHHLFAEAVGSKGACVGLKQQHEMEAFNVCARNGVAMLNTGERDENRHLVRDMINSSHCVVNAANFYGGGQRLTLEAMACDIPPIVMSDSPKNREYVEESGFGLVVNPDILSIREAVNDLKNSPMTGGRAYIMSKWTSKHYADSLEKGLLDL